MKKIDFKSSPIRNTRFSGELLECVFFGHPSIDVVDADAEIYREVAPDAVANRMDGWTSDASLINCHIGNYCYLDKVIPIPGAELHIATEPGLLRYRQRTAATRHARGAGQQIPDVAGDLLQAGRQAAPWRHRPAGSGQADGAALFFNTLRRAAIQAKTIVP